MIYFLLMQQNNIFWTKIGPGFGEQGGTSQLRTPGDTPRGLSLRRSESCCLITINQSMFYLPTLTSKSTSARSKYERANIKDLEVGRKYFSTNLLFNSVRYAMKHCILFDIMLFHNFLFCSVGRLAQVQWNSHSMKNPIF